jgi:hypothetical protein
MTATEFTRLLKPLCVKGRLSNARAAALDDATKEKLVAYIVRQRGPVVTSLLPSEPHPFVGYDTMTGWLAAMGYLHRTKGRRHTFLHTSAHTIA